MTIDFSGKTILVTGASGGIGQAIAQAFAKANGTVIIHYNSNQSGANDTLVSLSGDEHTTIQADLSDAKAIESLVTSLDTIDVVVNNAAVVEQYDFDALNFDQWHDVWNRTISVNLLGPAHLMFCVAKVMQKNGGGKFVNISSRGAFRGEPKAPAYGCLLYTSPSPRDGLLSRMPSSA